jgi:membrane protease YdiL (CAAX protease family)
LLIAMTQLAVFVAPFTYLVLGWQRGQTVGMRALDLRLIDAATGARIGGCQALLRLSGLFYSLLCAGIGLLWVAIDRDRRAWHDRLAGTAVLRVPRPRGWYGAVQAQQPVPPPPPPAGVTSTAAVAAASWRTTPWTWSDVVPALVLFYPLAIAAELAVIYALRQADTSLARDTRRALESLIGQFVAYAVNIGLIILLVRVRRHGRISDLGLRLPPARWFAAVLPFAVGAFVLTGIAGQLSSSLFPATPNNQCVDIRSEYSGLLPLAIVSVAILAPVAEETIFRGFVYGWLRGRLPVGWAVVISAVIFSLAHAGYLQQTIFLPIFASGLVLAVLYECSRSIWPGVLVHGVFNALATIAILNGHSC